MKKLLAVLLTAVMLLSLAACGALDDKTPSVDNDTDALQQEAEQEDTPVSDEEETPESDTQSDVKEEDTYEKEEGEGAWPKTDLTELLPTPAVENVIRSSQLDSFVMIEVSWTYDEALAYVKQLQDAGFGDDAVEKFEQQKTLKRSNNGVSIELVYMDDSLTMISVVKE